MKKIVATAVFTVVVILGCLFLIRPEKEQDGEVVKITERSGRFYPVAVHVVNETGIYELQRTEDGGTVIQAWRGSH